MHRKQLVFAGTPVSKDAKALIMLHGRGASAEDILSLAQHLDVDGFSLVAPQATNNTWYPSSFLAPVNQNEPWLSSALKVVEDLVQDLADAGVAHHHIYFLGFSQGACLTLEFVLRNARAWGGVVAFTGGAIGDSLDVRNYKGDFANSRIFIGTSDPDPHVPVERVNATADLLRSMHASVDIRIYKNMGHTITPEEINLANTFIFSK